mmetsp:Transcript_18286/g.34733  ORF Transcript_18286/g.34733 Transcript_18286/m.34733 type:complete len:528 (-) Transcript_18286:135-1718(-)
MGDQHDLLEFGTSVSVNDELRRTLVSEAVELQASIAKIEKDIKRETMSGTEQAKDQKHRTAEMQALHQSLKRTYDQLSFLYQHVFIPVNEKLKRELKSTPTEGLIASEKEEEDKSNGGDGEESKDKDKPPANKFPPYSMPGMRVKFAGLLKNSEELLCFFQDANEAFGNFTNQQESADVKREQIMQQLEEVQSDLSKNQEMTKTVSRNCQEEEDRLRSLEKELREMEMTYKAVVRETEEKKKMRDEKEKKYLQRKANLEADLAAMEENESRHVAAKQAKQAELELLQTQKKKLDHEYAEFCAWKAIYDAQQKKLKKERKERQSLFSLQTAMENEWSTQKGQLDRLEKEVSREEKISKKLQSENAAAAKKYQEVEDEIARMQNEAEELEALLMQEDEPDPVLKLMEAEENKVQQLQAELEATEKDIAEKDAILEEEKRLLSEETRKYAEQDNALKTERENLKKSILDVRVRIQEDKERYSSDILYQKRRYEVLKLAADAIASSKRKEQKYLQASKPKSDDPSGNDDVL